MSSSFILAMASPTRSAAFRSRMPWKSRNEGSLPPKRRWTTSEKLSPGRLAAFSLPYAESSKDMVLDPTYLCMCICVFNDLHPAGDAVRAPGVPAVHDGRVRGELRDFPREAEGEELPCREERERGDVARLVRSGEVQDPPCALEGDVLRDHHLDHAGVQVREEGVRVPVRGRALSSTTLSPGPGCRIPCGC